MIELNKNKKDDLFDRALFGSPGIMIAIIIGIIIVSLLVNALK